MDSSQVNAARALINKVLPDIRSIEHSGELEVTSVTKEQRDAAVAAATRADR
jgi:hypothetical protein